MVNGYALSGGICALKATYSGGIETTIGSNKLHAFNSSGTLTCNGTINGAKVLVVAGGGASISGGPSAGIAGQGFSGGDTSDRNNLGGGGGGSSGGLGSAGKDGNGGAGFSGDLAGLFAGGDGGSGIVIVRY